MFRIQLSLFVHVSLRGPPSILEVHFVYSKIIRMSILKTDTQFPIVLTTKLTEYFVRTNRVVIMSSEPKN